MANFNSPTRDRILTALKNGRMSVAELCDELQLARTIVSPAIKRTKKAKLIRISGWLKRHGMGHTWVPLYGLGGNPDAPKPTPLSQAQRSATSYQKHKAKVLAKTRRTTVNPLLDLLR